MKRKEKCAHPGCHCYARADSKYCSILRRRGRSSGASNAVAGILLVTIVKGRNSMKTLQLTFGALALIAIVSWEDALIPRNHRMCPTIFAIQLVSRP
jgi:hypothetical protein